MNRFATFTILALAVIAVANSAPLDEEFPGEAETRASLSTSPAEEVANLAPLKLEAFAPFCIQTRDHIYADLKDKAGKASSKGFSWFFSMADDVAREALSVNREVTAKYSHQLAHPNSEVDGDDNVAKTQLEIAGQTQPRALMTAFTGAISATATAIVEVVKQKAAKMNELVDPRMFLEVATYGCDQVRDYENEMRNMFHDFKKTLPADAKDLKDIKFEGVPCVTSRRMTRVNGVCGLISNSYAPFMSLYKNIVDFRQSTPTAEKN